MDFNVELQNPDIKSFAPQSNSYSSNNPTQGANYASSPSKNEEKKPIQQPTGCAAFLSIDYYKPYFNISQSDVLDRLKKSMTPWKKDFMDISRDAPDLYGPLWILTTVIFLLSSTGNLSTYFNNWDKDMFIFRLDLVRYAVILVYSLGIGMPVLLGLLLRFFGSAITIPQVLCLYGYSMTCFIPILILCVIPTNVLQWILMVYGILNSTAFLIFNMRSEISDIETTKQYIVYGILAATQLTIFLTFKLLFFNIVYSESK